LSRQQKDIDQASHLVDALSKSCTDCLSSKASPVLRVLPSQLADPSWRHAKSSSQVRGPFTNCHVADDPAITLGPGGQPGRKVQPERCLLVRRRHGVVLQPFLESVRCRWPVPACSSWWHPRLACPQCRRGAAKQFSNVGVGRTVVTIHAPVVWRSLARSSAPSPAQPAWP
jgi:hypothetical protein